MNILRAWRLWRKATKLVEEVRKMKKKPFWKSKTIWINILTAVIELSGALGGLVPVGTLQLTTNVLNVLLRLITNQPVTVLPSSGEE